MRRGPLRDFRKVRAFRSWTANGVYFRPRTLLKRLTLLHRPARDREVVRHAPKLSLRRNGEGPAVAGPPPARRCCLRSRSCRTLRRRCPLPSRRTSPVPCSCRSRSACTRGRCLSAPARRADAFSRAGRSLSRFRSGCIQRCTYLLRDFQFAPGSKCAYRPTRRRLDSVPGAVPVAARNAAFASHGPSKGATCESLLQ